MDKLLDFDTFVILGLVAMLATAIGGLYLCIRHARKDKLEQISRVDQKTGSIYR